MKRLVVLAAACHGSAAPTVEVRVDRRIELVSIVERLAGAHAYTTGAPTAYTAEVDRAFGALAD